jgi:hypothetical protein
MWILLGFFETKIHRLQGMLIECCEFVKQKRPSKGGIFCKPVRRTGRQKTEITG